MRPLPLRWHPKGGASLLITELTKTLREREIQNVSANGLCSVYSLDNHATYCSMPMPSHARHATDALRLRGRARVDPCHPTNSCGGDHTKRRFSS